MLPEREADIYYPIISRKPMIEFPGVNGYIACVKVFTGGNMALISPKVIQAYQPMINKHCHERNLGNSVAFGS